MSIITAYDGSIVATSMTWFRDPPRRETDLCKCGHQRRAHLEKTGRCYMEAWPRRFGVDQSNISLIKSGRIWRNVDNA
jgi:hypothetical protein